MTPFYAFLTSEIAISEAHSAVLRDALFARARVLLDRHIDSFSPRLSAAARNSVHRELEEAIWRIEAEAASASLPTVRSSAGVADPMHLEMEFDGGTVNAPAAEGDDADSANRRRGWRSAPLLSASSILNIVAACGLITALSWNTVGPPVADLVQKIMTQLERATIEPISGGLTTDGTIPAMKTGSPVTEKIQDQLPATGLGAPAIWPDTAVGDSAPTQTSAQTSPEALMSASPASGPFEAGFMAYQRGDFTAAVRLWRSLADRGHADAQINIGTMYFAGRGVALDDSEAERWFRKAANQGYAAARLNLGVLYFLGRGVPQDYVQAYKWWDLALSRFPALEGKSRDLGARYRDMAAAKMSPGKIEEAQRLAREWEPN